MNYYLSLCLSVFLFFSVGGRADEAAVYDDLPVSYTHLTLPTICSV